MQRLITLLLLALCAFLPACGGDGGSEGAAKTLLVAVNAPFSRTPYVGQTIADGAQLAADEANIQTDEGTYRLRIKRYDTGLSARRAVRNVRQAIADGAVAIVDEGTGVNASWRLADDADRPLGITYQGGVDLVDLEQRPNVFRIAPTDRGTAFRLAEYLIPKHPKIGLIVDDST